MLKSPTRAITTSLHHQPIVVAGWDPNKASASFKGINGEVTGVFCIVSLHFFFKIIFCVQVEVQRKAVLIHLSKVALDRMFGGTYASCYCSYHTIALVFQHFSSYSYIFIIYSDVVLSGMEWKVEKENPMSNARKSKPKSKKIKS